MSSITYSGMANLHSRETRVKSALEQKFERLQNNLEPQVEDLQKRLGQLQHDFNTLKCWLGILIPIVIAVLAAPGLLTKGAENVDSLRSWFNPATCTCTQQQWMDSQGQDRWCFVVGNYSKIAVSGEVATARLFVNKERVVTKYQRTPSYSVNLNQMPLVRHCPHAT